MAQRDVSRSPFKNPTSVENPPPDQYGLHSNPTLNTFAMPQTDYGAKPKEIKNDSVFKSNGQRDFLSCVSIEAKTSPGPGTYIDPNP